MQTVDRATVPLRGITAQVNATTDSLGEMAKTSDSADDVVADLRRQMAGLAAPAEAANDAIDGVTAALSSAGLISAIAASVVAITNLVSWIFKAYQEHERLEEAAKNLNLPVSKVEDYSDAWLKVAKNLSDATRGFDDLTAAQEKAFKALDINWRLPGAQDKALSRVAAMSGTRNEKIDVLRILTGLSEEEAAKELDAEIERLNERVRKGQARGATKSMTRAEAEGLTFGAEDAGQLLRTGQIASDARLKEIADAQREYEQRQKAIREGMELFEKDAEERRKAREKAAAEAWKIEQRNIENYIDELREADRVQTELAESVNEALAESSGELTKSLNQNMRNLESQLETTMEDVRIPIYSAVDDIKERLYDLAYDGKITARELGEALIHAFLDQRLYDAIDKVGDAIADMLSSASSGGGFWSNLFGGLSGVFGSRVGAPPINGSSGPTSSIGPFMASGGLASGMAIVGEDGPEVVEGGINTFRVLNRRQLAFQRDSGSSKGEAKLTYAPVYHLSGVETEKVIAYMERAREKDRDGMIRMIEDNGFGRLA